MAERFDASTNGTTGAEAANIQDTPLFSAFAETWYAEKEVEWSHYHRETVRLTLDTHLLPAFGDQPLGAIDKAAIMADRAELAKRPGHAGKRLSPSRVNHILNPLRMILREAAERFGIGDPMQTMKSLKVARSEIDMADAVEQALRTQQTLSGTRSKFGFCASNGEPLRHHNVTARVWYPLLRHPGAKTAPALPDPPHRRDAVARRWRESGMDRPADGTHHHRDVVSGLFALCAEPHPARWLGDEPAARGQWLRRSARYG